MSEQGLSEFGAVVGRTRARRRVGRIGVVGLPTAALLLVFHPWPRASPVVRGSSAVFTFSCCAAGDVTRAVHPGDPFVVHWIVAPATQRGASEPVTLEAKVFGPFTDVASLKAAFRDGSTPNVPVGQYVAPVVATQTTDGAARTSTIPLPVGAAPGFYDLETTVTSGGGEVAAGSIFQVTARG